jgi:uncharacterized membrane protein (UPF0182 family)
MWARYHADDPDDFYNGRDNWAVPKDAGATKKTGGTTVQLGADGQELTADDRYPSQYLLMQLPGEEDTSFVLLRPFVTAADSDDDRGQNQLRSFMVASSDPDDYGQLTTYEVAQDVLPDGPNLAADDIKANADVAEQIKSLCTEKTVCTFAAPSIVPVGDSLLYVQSFLVSGSEQGAPKLEHVIVNERRPGDQRVAIDTSLYGALTQLYGDGISPLIQGGEQAAEEPDEGESPTEQPDEPSDPVGTLTEQETALIDALVEAFDEADAAARDGDQVLYAEKIEEAGRIAAQLQELRSQGQPTARPSGEPSDSTTTTTTPQTTTTTTAGA